MRVLSNLTLLMARLISCWLVVCCLTTPSKAYTKTKFAVDEHFSKVIDQRIALTFYANRAFSGIKPKPKYLIAYFKALPRDCKTFYQLLHIRFRHGQPSFITPEPDNALLANPWEDTCKIDPDVQNICLKPSRKWRQILKKAKPTTKEYFHWELIPCVYHVERVGTYFFHNGATFDLNTILDEVKNYIPEEIYYEKILSLCIEGNTYSYAWETDGQLFRTHILNSIQKSMPVVAKILEEKTDDEVYSLFYYIIKYNKPRGDRYQSLERNRRCIKECLDEDYDRLYRSLVPLSPRLSGLLTKVYNQLLIDLELI